MAKATRYQPKSKRRSPDSVRTLISRSQIQKRITEMAQEIRRDFPVEPLHLVGVLKGSVFFLTDLARQITGEVSIDFIAVSSYGSNTHSSGEVKLTRDLDSSIEGKTVVVVEDILDTGMTLQYLLRVFEQRKPRRLRVAWPRSAPTMSASPFPTSSWSATAWTIPSATAISRMWASSRWASKRRNSSGFSRCSVSFRLPVIRARSPKF